MAAGIPTSGDPILLDISASLTTNGLTGRLFKAGEKLPHPWVQDAQGNATDDPAVLFNEPKGTLLPLGGLDAGHKGYGLALLVEAFTAALAGFGRADPPEGWGATVFVQVLDPAAFGGSAGYVRQTDWLADACHAAKPRPGGPAGAAAWREWHEAAPRTDHARRCALPVHHAGAPALGGEAGRGDAGGRLKDARVVAIAAGHCPMPRFLPQSAVTAFAQPSA